MRIYDIFLNGSFYGYAWAMSPEEAIEKATGLKGEEARLFYAVTNG